MQYLIVYNNKGETIPNAMIELLGSQVVGAP